MWGECIVSVSETTRAGTVSETKQFCTFYLDNLFFGINVLDVQEIIRYQDMTSVPLSPAVVEGLINLRGQIVTAIDMRRRLELPERDPETEPINVIIQTDDDSTASLLVDEIGDVIEVSEDLFERPPDTLKGTARELIEGAYKLEDTLLLVLNTTKTLDISATGAKNEEGRSS